MREILEKIERLMQWCIVAFVFAIILATSCHGDTIAITPTGEVYVVGRSLAWNTNGPGGTNNTYVFSPLYTSESIYFFVVNNNTTRNNTATVAIYKTDDPSAAFSATTWSQTVPERVLGNLTTLYGSGVPVITPLAGAYVYSRVSGAAQVAISVTTTSNTGSPQTDDFFIVQANDNQQEAFGGQVAQGIAFASVPTGLGPGSVNAALLNGSLVNQFSQGWTYLWNGATFDVWTDGTTTGAADVNIKSGTITPPVPATGTYTNRSGSIAAGGTSQTLAAVNASRKQIVIENPCSIASQGIAATENLFINFTSAASLTAGTSIELLPCGSYSSGSGPVTTEAITVNATTTGHQYTAKEM